MAKLIIQIFLARKIHGFLCKNNRKIATFGVDEKDLKLQFRHNFAEYDITVRRTKF